MISIQETKTYHLFNKRNKRNKRKDLAKRNCIKLNYIHKFIIIDS